MTRAQAKPRSARCAARGGLSRRRFKPLAETACSRFELAWRETAPHGVGEVDDFASPVPVDADLFALQDATTSRIAIALNLELIFAEAGRATDHPDALDYILRGRAAISTSPSRDSYVEAIGLCECALALEPRSVETQSWLASTLVDPCAVWNEPFGRLGGKRAAVVFTDPPYNVPIDGHASGLGAVHHRPFPMASGEMDKAEFTGFLREAFRNLAAFSLDGALHFICMDWRHLDQLLTAGGDAYGELKN